MIISVNLANVSLTNCDYDSLSLEPSHSAQCVSKGKSEEYDCRNHVRVIQPIGNIYLMLISRNFDDVDLPCTVHTYRYKIFFHIYCKYF